MSDPASGAMPEPRGDASGLNPAGNEAAARVLRDALKLRDLWSADLEAAWASWSRTFPHVDEVTLKMLREAFERGYRGEHKVPLVIVVPDPRPPAP